MSESSIEGISLIPNDDPILHSRAEPIEEENFSDTLRLIHQARNFLHQHGGGVGLAAPQVGVPKRFFIIYYGGREIICINPELINHTDTMVVDNEGCLSYPNVVVPVSRYKRIKVRYQTPEGDIKQHYMKDMMARIFQHELDHLDGIVHIDRAKEQGHI